MFRNTLAKTVVACGVFALCVMAAGCEESTPVGPDGREAGTAPPGFQPVPPPGGGDLTPTATSGGGDGSTRGTTGSTTGGSGG